MNNLSKKRTITGVLILFLSVVITLLMSFLYDKTWGEIIRNGVFSLAFSLGLIYFLLYSLKTDRLDYDNAEHPYRFLVVYMSGLLLTVLFPMIDKKGWIFLTIAISIALFSNTIIAFYVISSFIVLTVLLAGTDIVAVAVYFLASFLGILLFQDIDKQFKVTASIFLSVLFLAILEIAGFVMLDNSKLDAEQFIMPIVNIAINSIAMFFCLKYFNTTVANRYRNKYLELNDQEYSALIELKNVSKEEYYRSIHTAYLAERMANKIGCDVDVTKNCAYYHRIKKAFNLSEKECEEFVVKNQFPPKASKQLLEFLDKNSRLVSKEACIVYISDKFISTIMSIFAKDKKAKIDYAALVDTLFEKNFIRETLSESDLTHKDFRSIKEIILKETLYYDFFR